MVLHPVYLAFCTKNIRKNRFLFGIILNVNVLTGKEVAVWH